MAASAPAISEHFPTSDVNVSPVFRRPSATIDSVPTYGVKRNLMASDLTIGRLAESAGVNIETIRYYQRRGLLHEPNKPPGGQRRYSTGEAKRVRSIKRAQALGFTLDEVGALLNLDSACACAQTRMLADNKRTLIKRKMADLAAMHRVLGDLVRRCEADGGELACPIIDVLVKD